jgi:sec-independent protein translocase protein TatA
MGLRMFTNCIFAAQIRLLQTIKQIDIMNHLLFLPNLGTGEIIIIALAILLIFGGKKIPELMKGIGKGVKNFKDGVKGLEDDINLNDTDNTPDKK